MYWAMFVWGSIAAAFLFFVFVIPALLIAA
jgi:hypothetical protein